jgi:serine/threonine protein kinase
VSDPSDLKPGELIAGKYTVEGPIGSGGMGRVYAAVNAAIGQKVAIKVLRQDVSQIAGTSARFVQEARAAVSLTSEHVGRVFDVGTLEGDIPYMVMERLTGETVGQMLKQGPIAPHLLVSIMAQVSDAILEAHTRGIIHRDIKPANIFVTVRQNGRQHAKILDFGISKAFGEAASGDDLGLTTTGTALGTPRYMSPEQMSDAALVGPSTDVWALGVTMYYALSKVYPFDSSNALGLAIKIANEEPAPLETVAPKVPIELCHLVTACMQKLPANRLEMSELLPRLEELALELAPVTKLSLPSLTSTQGIRAAAARSSAPSASVVRSSLPAALLKPIPASAALPMLVVDDADTKAMVSPYHVPPPLSAAPPVFAEVVSEIPHETQLAADKPSTGRISTAKRNRAPYAILFVAAFMATGGLALVFSPSLRARAQSGHGPAPEGSGFPEEPAVLKVPAVPTVTASAATGVTASPEPVSAVVATAKVVGTAQATHASPLVTAKTGIVRGTAVVPQSSKSSKVMATDR